MHMQHLALAAGVLLLAVPSASRVQAFTVDADLTAAVGGSAALVDPDDKARDMFGGGEEEGVTSGRPWLGSGAKAVNAFGVSPWTPAGLQPDPVPGTLSGPAAAKADSASRGKRQIGR